MRVLNVLVAGHAQHGKSSLIEAIVGKFPDNLDYELAHGTTVSLKVIQFLLKKNKLQLNFLDSPGHADFKGSIALGLEFTDVLLLVISGSEGFQAQTYWLFEKAREKGLPIIIAATKMDLASASIQKIKNELIKREESKIPIIKTSSKELFGIEELVKRLSINVKRRESRESDLSFIILGYAKRKGLGELMNIGIQSGSIEPNQWITDKIKTKHLFNLNGTGLKRAEEGDIVQVSLNVVISNDLGTKYRNGKLIPPRFESLLSEIHPSKEFHISMDDPVEFKIAMDILESIKKTIPSFDFYVDEKQINILVLGDVQFDFIKEALESLIDFKIIGSKIKGIITIDSVSSARYNSAHVRIYPRCRKALTITKEGTQEKGMIDIIGATTAYEAFHLDGLHVDIISGRNEDDIAQAIAKAVEKVKIIKMTPYQDVIVKVENYNDVFSLIEKYNVELLYQNQSNTFFLQVKNKEFESFFNSLMKVSKGRAEINLFKFEQDDIILSVDPGTRHYGFCLIEKGELPSLWYVNLKKNIDDPRTHNNARKQIIKELDIFFGAGKEFINKIFIGDGPGSRFIIDFFIEYFSIPCDEYSCVITDLESADNEEIKDLTIKERFSPPEIYLVDEFKTTKEALFHLQQGKLVSEVRTKGFVDHAIAALLIARRGLKGEVIKIEKKPLKQLHEYIMEHFSGSISFSTIHNVSGLEDLKTGMYLRIKDSTKLDSNLNNGDIISFIGFGNSYNNIQASTLSSNRILIKFQGGVKVRRDFFKIFMPVKERK